MSGWESVAVKSRQHRKPQQNFRSSFLVKFLFPISCMVQFVIIQSVVDELNKQPVPLVELKGL